MSEEYICPFCKEADFDAMGLKLHLTRGWCDVFETIEARTMFEQDMLRARSPGVPHGTKEPGA